MAFVKGQSGNPGGRSKEIREVSKAARVHTADALATLASICCDIDAPPPARVSAAVALLNRAWGMPAQHVTAAVITDPDIMTDEQLAAIAAGSGKASALSEEDTDEL
jgi:hypothetical protein